MNQKKGKALLVVLMLLISLIAQVSPAMALGDVVINEANFPDANFREFVKKYDKNNDGVLQQSERDDVDSIDCSEQEIADLAGVEHFTELFFLQCYRNKITKLDVSKNTMLEILVLTSNQITEIDISQNPKLENLHCSKNQLKALDVSNNPKLISLHCSKNQLKSLDVSNNTKLMSLECSDNQLTKLDVSKHPLLERIDVSNNQITEINVNQKPKLRQLYCSNNQIAELDVSNNPFLDIFDLDNNKITEIDVSQNPKLRQLYCSNNQLTSLDLSQNSELDHSETRLSNQSYPTPLISKWKGGFEFDLSGIPGVKLVDILEVNKFEGNPLPGSASYDPDTGILRIGSDEPVHKLIYRCDVKSPIAEITTMDVVISLIYKAVVRLDPDNGIDPPQVIEESGEIRAWGETYSYALPDCTFAAPTGKAFKAWEVDGNELQPGEHIDAKEYTDIKALWADSSTSDAEATTDSESGTPKETGQSKPEMTPSKSTDSQQTAGKIGTILPWLLLLVLTLLVAGILFIVLRKKKRT